MGLLAAVLVWTLAGMTWRGVPLGGAFCIVATLCLTSLEEASQVVIPGRTFSWIDLAYSWSGILLLGGFAALIRRRGAGTAVSEDAAAPERTS